MKKFVLSAVLGLTFTVPFAASVAAQDLGFAYQFERLSEDESHVNMPAGFAVDGTFPIGGGKIGILGELDWARKEEGGATLQILGAGGGVRWASMKSPKVTPFIQGTLGVVHHKSEDEDGKETGNNFALSFDGGVAVPCGQKTSIVGQVGYRWLSDNEPIHFLRVLAGIRIKLSK